MDVNTEDGLAQFMRSEPELEFVNQVKMERCVHGDSRSQSSSGLRCGPRGGLRGALRYAMCVGQSIVESDAWT